MCKPSWLCLELQGLDNLHKLQLLELGDNRLATIEGLGALKQLQELWLGRNRITHIANLDGCASSYSVLEGECYVLGSY